MDQSDPIENYRNIREELKQYDVSLAQRPEIPVVTKCELPDASAVAELLEEEIGRPVLQISAVTGKRLPGLTQQVLQMLSEFDEAVTPG